MTEILIQQAAAVLEAAQRIVVLTGAGVSKESGVPTFRDAQTGLWAQYDPTELATPDAFRRNPKLVWDWYAFRRQIIAGVGPNSGHVALAQLQARKPATRVVTQNVDDLHEQAGSTEVIHLHGSIAQDKCHANCQGEPTLVDVSALTWDAEAGPPTCPHCGGHVRPNVVWFGEMLPTDALNTAMQLVSACEVMLVVGTSGLVTPAATLPSLAKSAGATVIEVNPDYSMITRIADLKLEGASGEMLPRVLAVMDAYDQ